MPTAAPSGVIPDDRMTKWVHVGNYRWSPGGCRAVYSLTVRFPEDRAFIAFIVKHLERYFQILIIAVYNSVVDTGYKATLKQHDAPRS